MTTSSRELRGLPVDETFVRATGPGGQNVNKVATAVELRFHVDRADLPQIVKARLKVLVGSRLTGEGDILIEAREHRTQARNREAARARLLALIARARRAPKKRRATKPPPAAREHRLETKTRRSAIKQNRATPRGDE